MAILIASVLLLQDPGLDRLIEELRSENVQERERAELGLRRIGEDAVAALERVAADKDLEVAGRARGCLNRIRDDAGARTLRKIEESAAKAGSLSLKLSNAAPSPKARRVGWALLGSALLREGNRLFLSAETYTEDGRREVTFHCDGSRFGFFRGSFGTLEADWGDRGWDYNVEVLPRLISAGLWVTAQMLDLRPPSKDQGSLNAAPALRLSDFRRAAQGGVGTLSYRVGYAPAGSGEGMFRLQATLGYDQTTWRPLWRTFQVTLNRDHEVSFEAREEFRFDADIPDEKFKVPNDSKFR